MRFGSLKDLDITANGLVLGVKAAKRLGAELGDTVSLTSANGIAKRFKIVGLFHTGITASDEGIAYAPLKAVQILLEKPDIINSISIKLSDIDKANEVAARAERQLGYKALSWQEANEGLMEAFFVRNIIMYTVVGAILVVAGFGIFNIVSTIVHEKAKDIAILKSLGFPESDIQQIFVLEGLVIGIMGALLGSALGFRAFKLSRHHQIRTHHGCGSDAAADPLFRASLRHCLCTRPVLVCCRRLYPRTESGTAQPGRHHPGGDMTDAAAPKTDPDPCSSGNQGPHPDSAGCCSGDPGRGCNLPGRSG